ncbi:MAG: peptidase M16 [Chloracidobacterium sp. CP2_5A]|nr:MAG: peptidase M16 [Chloracidobacterium sp. CP2_5A]
MTMPASPSLLTAGVQRHILSNGLTVLLKEATSSPIVSAMIWYRVGSRNEPAGKTGLSHFLEHMMFKGTRRLGKGEIDHLTLVNGGRNNAFTWMDFTAYYFAFAADRWDVALEIEADRAQNAAFDPAEFESERQVVLEELQMCLDSPFDALEMEIWATAFRQHPYRAPTIGWREDVERLTVDDMRRYYESYYCPNNATLVVVGDIRPEAALRRIEATFGALPMRDVPPPPHACEPPQRGEKRVTVKKPTPLPRLTIGYHAPEVAHPDSYALHVASMLLSYGRTSRLYQRLQEKDESVTFATAHYAEHIDPSLFTIAAEVKPDRAPAEVEAAITEEVERLAQEPPTELELAKAKRQTEAQFILGNEEILNQAMLLGEYETIACGPRVTEDARGYRYLDAYLQRARQVSAADIQQAAAAYLRRDNRTVGWLVNP